MSIRSQMTSRLGRWFLIAVFATGGAGALLGQQKNAPIVRPSDEQLIETNIGEMLAGWQIGDVDLLHRHYADDVLVVSGAYEPPLIGWASYLAGYQLQRQRMQSVRLDRRNTYVKVKGNFAWSTYQWEFSAIADGRPMGAQGHATLVWEKRADRWLIVHNHTSVVAVTAAQPPQQVAQPPEKPGN